ncbi:MAG: HAD family hydrolase [Alphaproteobacteria bacterium]|nr:HAD family hydrolase [Alphaproteobacteria bacterium]
MKNRKLIVWDWNGTVIADEEAALGALNQAIALRNRAPIDMERWREAFDMPITKIYANIGFSAKELDEHLESMSTVFHEHFERLAETTSLREGWTDIVSDGVDFDNIILSNHLIPSIKYHTARHGISGLFADILAHADQNEQLRKIPKANRLRNYMQERGLPSNQAIIIGDTPEEALIGRELGIVSILISGGYATQQRLEAARPDHLVHSLRELPFILQQYGFLP